VGHKREYCPSSPQAFGVTFPIDILAILNQSMLLKIDEDTVLTGSSDGLVRAVQLNCLVRELGGHDGFPVGVLRWSAGMKMVGSLVMMSTFNFGSFEGGCGSVNRVLCSWCRIGGE
jgi:hypothetical protein